MKVEIINTPYHPSISVAEFMIQIRKQFPKVKLKHIRMIALEAEKLHVTDCTSAYEGGRRLRAVLRQSDPSQKSKQARYNKNPR